VLYRLLDLMRASGTSLTAHIDVQLIDAINPSTSYLLRSIGQHLLDANTAVRQVEGFGLFGQSSSSVKDHSEEDIFELFAQDLKKILYKTQQKVTLLFDEIERMSPEAVGSKWGDASGLAYTNILIQ
jgi:hypothetical protein